MTGVVAIAMNNWNDHNARFCNLGIFFTVLRTLALQSYSLTTAAALVYVPVTLWAHCHHAIALAIYAQHQSTGNPQGVTSKPRCPANARHPPTISQPTSSIPYMHSQK